MNSNNDIENTRKVSARKWDELLDRYFSSVILPKVDTERVITLTHLKILHERMSRSRRMWRMISLCSVAACLAIVVAMTVAYREENGAAASSVILADGTTSDDTGLDDYNELNVPAGQRMTLMLADGTRLMANSRSQVRYPSRFDGDTRRIWASGEVYLEVAKDADRPFVMSGDGFDVTVLGTTFCVSSYHPGKASIVLIEGSVAVTTDTDECIRMRPSQKVDIAEGSVDGIFGCRHLILYLLDQGRHNAQGSDTRPGGRAAKHILRCGYRDRPDPIQPPPVRSPRPQGGYRRGAVGTVLHHINGCRQGKRRQPPLPTDCQIGILLNNLLNKSTIIINQSN